MLIPIGEDIQVTVSGRTIKNVCCEYCSCNYSFEHTSTASGSGFSFLFLGGRGVRKRAAEQAQNKLDEELKSGVAFAPCPRCYRYQPAMVARMQAGRLTWMNPVGIVILMFTSVIFGIIALINYLPRNRATADWPGFWLALAAAVGFGLAFIVGRRLIVQWLDPNASPEEKRQALARRTSFRDDDEYALAKAVNLRESAEAEKRSLRAEPWARWVVAGGIGFLCVWFAVQIGWASWRDIERANESESWPTARATITASGAELTRQTNREQIFTPRIEYAYTVGGVNYVSNRLSLYAESGPQFHDFAARMPVGNQIEVRYAPANPAIAIIHAGDSSGDVGVLLFVAVFGLVCGIGAATYMVNIERERRRDYRAVCKQLEALPPLGDLLRRQDERRLAVHV